MEQQQQQQPPPPYDYSQKQVYDPSLVPGQQVYYVPYLVAGQQRVNVSPYPSPIPQQQVYAPGPQQQVINVGPQPSSGPRMVGGSHRFSSEAISTTCPACKNQVGKYLLL